MSLQVWLPFNGSLDNYGLDALAWVQSSAVYSSNAKLGKALNCKDSSIQFTSTAMKDCSKFTISFWIYCESNSSYTRDFNAAISVGDYGSCLRFESTYSTNICGVLLANNYGNNLASSTGNILVKDKDKWNHIVITYNEIELRTFVNGVCTTVLDSNKGKLNGNVIMSDKTYYGQINDFRMYDEVISDRQIIELSKGLIAHYPLDNIYECPNKNLITEPCSQGGLYPSTNNSVVTKLDNEPGYNFKIKFTGDGTSNWIHLYSRNFSFTAGKQYTYSGYYRINQNADIVLGFRASYFSNHWEASTCNVSIADGKWHKFSITTTIPATFTRPSNGSVITSNPIFEIWSNNLNIKNHNYSIDFDLKDISVYEASTSLPWKENSLGTTVQPIKNVTGYGCDLTQENISFSSDAVRNNGSYVFSNNSVAGATDASALFPVNKLIRELTISMWFKTTKANDNPNVISIGGNNGIRMRLNEKGYYYYIRAVDGNFISSSMAIGTSISDNKWHHATFVFNGGYVATYFDGTKLGVANHSSVTKQIKILTSQLWLAAFLKGQEQFIGQLSDVRIYSTGLVESDIKALYNNIASIDNYGNCICNTIIEDDAISQSTVTDRGIITTVNMSELSGASEDMLFKTLDDGSIWARIFHHDLSISNTYFSSVDKDEATYCIDTVHGKYSRLYLIPELKSSDGYYEYMLTYPKISTTKYNRWKQTMNPFNVTSTIANQTAAYMGYSAIHLDWTTEWGYGLRLRGLGVTYMDCNAGRNVWYGAIGQMVRWTADDTSAIPAVTSSSTTETELWARVDNLPNETKVQIYQKSISAKEFIEK